MTATAEIAPTVGPGFFHEAMPLDDLRPSPLNPRKHFDQGKLEELARTIREVGVIEPLVARPVRDRYELVAGERRYRAARQVGLTTVPCIVKMLTDAQALELMVIENNQREDVSALEEADGFARLLESGYELDVLAERLGRSKKYVYDRIKLRDLAPEARQLLEAGKLTAGHAILLARLKPADQERAIAPEDGGAFTWEHARSSADDDEGREAVARSRAARKGKGFTLEAYADRKAVSVRELGDWIAHHVRFRPAEAGAAAPLEHGDVARQVAEASAKPGKGKKVIAITLEHFIQPEARDGDERTYGPRSFKFADGKPHRDYGSYRDDVAKPCEHAVLGVVAVGEKYGQAFDVCVARDKCLVHWKAEIDQAKRNQKLRDSGQHDKAEKREAAAALKADERRKLEELEDARRRKAETRALNLAVDRVTELTPDCLRLVLSNLLTAEIDHEAFNARFGTRLSWGGASIKQLKSLSGKTLLQAVVFAALSAEIVTDSADVDAALGLFKVELAKVVADVRREDEAAAKTVQTSAQPQKTGAQKKKGKR